MKDRILEYMEKNCCGFRRGKPRKEICEALGIPDRALRQIAEELKREGHIATNVKDGYYFLPLVVRHDPDEILAYKHSISDKRSRAVKLLHEAQEMDKHLRARIDAQEQMVF